MVRPLLEYALAVWAPHKQKDIQLLEKVQRQATRYMSSQVHDQQLHMDRSPGTFTSMLENLKWTSLEHKRRQICLGMLYKIN